jgi:gliding motility-associated-like protein
MPGSPSLNIDKNTGYLIVRPSQKGLFVFRVVCIEYRNGVEIGRINRDFQILVDECKDSFKPEITLLNHDGQEYIEGDTLLISGRNDLCFDLYVKDNDLDDLVDFKISPINFSSKDAIFSPNPITTTDQLDSVRVKMCWPDCINSDDQELFEFYLIAADNSCPVQNFDSTRVVLKVIEENNSKPQIQLEVDQIDWSIEEPFYMNVYAWDNDVNDTLNISVESKNGTLKYHLIQENIGNPVNGRFSFSANCENISQSPFDFIFKVEDNSCAVNNSDFIPFKAVINEFLEIEIPDLKPANVITPNGDGINDFFSFNLSVPELCEFKNFEEVVIYNRWGIKIYNSNDKNFRWAADNVTSGQYFYQIQFESKSIKGFIHVIK